jgi:putative sigma-54 modulation protein
MELKIQSIHFDASEKLQEFIQKKIAKIEKNSDDIRSAEVVLKVVKPEVAMNKETAIRLRVPSGELYAEKVCDTFEEGVDLCVEALQKQLSKYKEKLRGR